jgi:hypothetical protein
VADEALDLGVVLERELVDEVHDQVDQEVSGLLDVEHLERVDEEARSVGVDHRVHQAVEQDRDRLHFRHQLVLRPQRVEE